MVDKKVAIIIPCYNEELTIGKVVSDWRKQLPYSAIYVYDNNSTDGSVKAAAAAGSIVRTECKQGKGNVVKAMFNEIDADCYIMVDADDTYSTHAAKQFVDLILIEEYDMVIGDRLSSTYYKENKRPFHSLGNFMINKLINCRYKSDIKDALSGLRAFSRKAVKNFNITTIGFEIESEITIQAIKKNMKIGNIVIEYRDRCSGSKSKLKTVIDGIRILATILRDEKKV